MFIQFSSYVRSGQVTPVAGWPLGHFDAFTLRLHLSRSLASLCTPPHFSLSNSQCHPAMSFLTFLFHGSLSPCHASLCMPGFLLSVWHVQIIAAFSAVPLPVKAHILQLSPSPFVVLLHLRLCFHVIPSILLKHLNSKACDLFNCFVVCPSLTSIEDNGDDQ